MNQLLNEAKKVKKVIDSCTTYEQLGKARNYTNNFFTKNSTKVEEPQLGTVYEADQAVIKLYTNLTKLIEEKEHTLKLVLNKQGNFVTIVD